MRVLRSLAIAATSLVLFFGLAEGVARLVGVKAKRPSGPVFSWVERGELYTMEPNQPWVLPGNMKLVRVNSLGLRGPEIGEKGAWERVLLLGDSVAFGYGVAEKEALPAQLKKALFLDGTLLEVVSAAVPGWCARQHRLFLEKNGPSLTPDLVLATVVLNDIPELRQGQAELGASVDSANALNWLTQHSALAAAARNALAASDSPFARAAYIRKLTTAPDDEESRLGMEAELAELRGVADAADAIGVPLGLVILPFKFQLRQPDDDAPQKQIIAFAEENGLPVLDLLPTLKDYDPQEVFVDQVHLSNLGNELVGQTIASWLSERRMVGPD